MSEAGFLRGLAVRPEPRELELEGLEWLAAHTSVVFVYAEHRPFTVIQPQDLENASHGIDEPRMAHTFARVHREFLRSVSLRRGWAQDLADPVWRQREIRLA